MKVKRLLMLAVLLSVMTGQGWAQSKFTITGTVVEEEKRELVAGANVSVCTVEDTTVVTGAYTDLKGVFTVNNVKKGKYLLRVTYIGLHPKTLSLDLTNEKKKTHDVGYILLSEDTKMLQMAEVTAQVSKVQVKGDSLMFNADAYRLQEGSVLEDLVKRLPGATVDQDGTIKINGKEVKKILVDGKEFFINDKSIAMKNLPTNIIDKIKAYDRKSDLARVTGIDDGEEETVLDLTVKKGMNNGWFGQISGGAGTEHRYNGRANVNRFNGSNQYSLVLSANNVGDRGFGGGGGRGWGWGGSGLRASKEAGFNFATITADEKLESGGYVWHRYDGSDAWSHSATQSFVSKLGSFSNNTNQNYGSNMSLSAGFRFEWKPDTMTNIIFRPNASYSRNRGMAWGESGTYSEDPNSYDDALMQTAESNFEAGTTITGDDDIDKIIAMIVNTNKSRSQSYSNSRGANGELQLNRKLNNRGRNITLRLTGGFNNSESEQLSASAIRYTASSGKTATDNNRYYTTPGRSHNYSIQTTYSEPIADRTYLQFSYRFNYSYNKSDRDAFTFDDPTAYTDLASALRLHRYDIAGALDQLLSNPVHVQTYDSRLSQFSEYRNMDHTIGLTFRMTRDKYNLNVGFELLPQHSELNYKYMGTEYPKVKRDVFNFTPTANLRYKFNDMTNLQFTYRGRTSQPSMTNLLEITDDSNPLNIRKGNSGLKPSFNSNFRLFFNTYNAEHQRGIFTFLNFGFTRNSIENRTEYDEATGVSTTQPININGNWNAGLGFGFNTAMGSENNFTMNSFTRLSYNNHVGFVSTSSSPESVKSTTKSVGVNENLSFSYRNDWIEAGINGSLNYSHSNNNVVTNLQNTYNFSYGAEIQLNAPWGTSLTSDIAMNSRRGYTQAAMNTNELIWNAALSQSFLKGKALTFSFEWNDILRRQSNVSRTVNALMSSDSQYNAIYSYGMVRVIYKLNIFGGKNANGTANERDQWGRTSREGGNRPGGPGGRSSGGARPVGRPAPTIIVR